MNQAAMELNRDNDLDPQPPVYAMLSDLRDFYFLSYDGTQFRVISEFSIVQRPSNAIDDRDGPRYLSTPSPTAGIILIPNSSRRRIVFCPAEWIY